MIYGESPRPRRRRGKVLDSGGDENRKMDMEEMVAGIVCMLFVLSIFLVVWYRRRQISQSKREEEAEPLTDRAVRRPGAGRMRRRPTAASSSVASSSRTMTTMEGMYDEVDEDAYAPEYNMEKASSKKARKKQEREEQRQADEAARELKERKRNYYDEMRRKRDEEREAKERLMEEEALARKAKEEEAAALEFENWKGEFSVDSEGMTENEIIEGSQGLLADFIDYIKKQKCVLLEDLAAEFKLRTQMY